MKDILLGYKAAGCPASRARDRRDLPGWDAALFGLYASESPQYDDQD